MGIHTSVPTFNLVTEGCELLSIQVPCTEESWPVSACSILLAICREITAPKGSSAHTAGLNLAFLTLSQGTLPRATLCMSVGFSGAGGMCLI